MELTLSMRRSRRLWRVARVVRLGAIWLALACAPAVAGMDDGAVYKVLQFYGLGGTEIDPKTQGVEGGVFLPGIDARPG